MLEIPNSLVSKLEQFQTEYPEIVYKFYLKKIEEAVNRRKNKAKFYRIKGTNVVAGVEEHDYLETLYELQETFVENELLASLLLYVDPKFVLLNLLFFC